MFGMMAAMRKSVRVVVSNGEDARAHARTFRVRALLSTSVKRHNFGPLWNTYWPEYEPFVPDDPEKPIFAEHMNTLAQSGLLAQRKGEGGDVHRPRMRSAFRGQGAGVPLTD